MNYYIRLYADDNGPGLWLVFEEWEELPLYICKTRKEAEETIKRLERLDKVGEA